MFVCTVVLPVTVGDLYISYLEHGSLCLLKFLGLFVEEVLVSVDLGLGLS